MITPAPHAPLGSPRYQIRSLIGAGSMGAVYRAYDLLAGHEVALKRVLLAAGATEAEAERERLALAHEFAVLAGLRHPHIISVLDYGFDAARQPFYTMELLERAEPILAAGLGLSDQERVALLVAALEALAYLHRRGILHHDLNPSNILIADGRLRLLDFGLAVLSEQQRESDSFGTLLYMAPEIIQDQRYTEAADLYSLGVVAYELLLGQHPFDAQSMRGFIEQVCTQPPDLRALADRPALAAVLGRLLAKEPGQRPTSAQAAIADLRAAIGAQPAPPSSAIRESYLQGASFIGRERELGQLGAAIAAAAQGRGAAYLVGGESGVGKSRLLDELRTRALVAGLDVIRGQAVEGGGLSYQLWREPLRPLLLAAELSDLEAGVLRELAPDIATLIDRPVEEAPPLAGEAGQQRLVLTIVDLIARRAQPTLLLLEDLQWCIESLLPLAPLARLAPERPLLIVASYRDDEAPQLPAQLPGLSALRLMRLSEPETAALCRSMIGAADDALVARLQRETEGNSLFLVELVRALAEESGDLAQVGQASELRPGLMAGGIAQVIQRRMARVPAWAQPALAAAAVVGRTIDPALVAELFPALDLDGWLRACSDAAVLEVQGERWRFSHDQLRAGLLAAIAPPERAALHAAVVEAIEEIYGDELEPHYSDLFAHAAEAGDRARERHYAWLAGAQTAERYLNAQALFLLGRALELTEPDESVLRYDLLRAREQIYDLQGQRELQASDLVALAQAADELGDELRRAHVLVRQAAHARAVDDYPRAIALARRAADLAEPLGAAGLAAEARLIWGAACTPLGDYPAALAQLEAARALAPGAPAQEAAALSEIGYIFAIQGRFADAQRHFADALRIDQALGDRSGEAARQIRLGWATFEEGGLAEAERCYARALQLCRATGAARAEAQLLGNWGDLVVRGHGDWPRARALFLDALRIAQQVGDRATQALSLANLGYFSYRMGELEPARAWTQEALAVAQQTGERRMEGYALAILGNLAVEAGDLDQADALLAASLAATELVGDMGALCELRAALARAALARGDAPRALAHAEQILAHLAHSELRGVNEPVRVHFTCYLALDAAGDARAAACLERAHATLLAEAAQLGDPERRAQYLSQIALHRAVLAALGR